MRFVLMCLLLVSCGSSDLREFSSVSPDFQPYVDSFELDFGIKVGDIPIGITPLKEDVVAACRQYVDSYGATMYSEIVVSAYFYSLFKNNKESMEIILYHELGHCRLGINGHNSIIINGCPESLMRRDTFSQREIDRCYRPNKQYYIQELKNEAANERLF